MVFHLLQQISKAPCQWRWRLAPTLALTLARKRGRRCHRLSCERSWYISVPHFSIPGRYRINNVHTLYIFWLFILCIIKYSLFVYILNHILIRIYNTSWNIIYIYTVSTQYAHISSHFHTRLLPSHHCWKNASWRPWHQGICPWLRRNFGPIFQQPRARQVTCAAAPGSEENEVI